MTARNLPIIPCRVSTDILLFLSKILLCSLLLYIVVVVGVDAKADVDDKVAFITCSPTLTSISLSFLEQWGGGEQFSVSADWGIVVVEGDDVEFLLTLVSVVTRKSKKKERIKTKTTKA